MNNTALKKKNLKCAECDTTLRLCSAGIICRKNHIIRKDTQEWLDIETIVLDKPTIVKAEDSYDSSYDDDDIGVTFMMRTRHM